MFQLPRITGKTRTKKVKDLTDREPTNEEILKSGEFTLKWVGKNRDHKTKWEEEEKFRERFLKEGLPVRKCTVVSPRNYIERVSDQDLQYMPR
jgi:hypothetical protein